jgi:nucleotide-binding universal stress UspA family protein
LKNAMKIIVSYDGSTGAEAALRELRRAGLPSDVEALVMTVAEPWPDAAVIHYEKGTLENPLWNADDAGQMAVHGAETLRTEFPDWTISTGGFEGSPTREVIHKADEWHADLVVVGPHGRGSAGRDAFGSISQQVITSAHCSVRIAREDKSHEGEPVRILLAYDGSPDADVALEHILSRTWPAHTKVILLTAIPSYYDADDMLQEEENTRAMHEEIRKRLAEAGHGYESVIEPYDPKHLILSEAEDHDVDCIFMGSRGLTPFERSLVGSVSASIAARAKCSVEVVRKRRE